MAPCQPSTDHPPLVWVISQNLKRRHLDATQKAVIAYEALPLFEAEAKERLKEAGKVGGKSESKGTQKFAEAKGEAREQAAKTTGANRQYVQDVKRIAEKLPELLPKMKAGEVTMAEALVEADFKQSVEAMTSSESDEWYTPNGATFLRLSPHLRCQKIPTARSPHLKAPSTFMALLSIWVP
jgi:hypothetical protein